MNRQLNKLITDESFQRFLLGTATFKEFSKWDKWIDENPGNKQIYKQALELWESAKFCSTPPTDLETEWKRLQERLTGTRKSRTYFLSDRKRSRSSFSTVGIMLVLGIVIVTVFWRFGLLPDNFTGGRESAMQSVQTEYGQRATINLPDGTTIILNANSELNYPAAWNEQTSRRIRLHGEAYFHVADKPPGPQDKFLVLTEDGQVKVVGTKFSVYERGHGTRVALEEGKVEVSSSPEAEATPEVEKAILKPGELIEFVKNSQQLIPRYVDISPYVTWWHKELLLVNTPFADIVQRLEETYGVDVEVLDSKLLKRTLSGSIENQNLTIVTDALAAALRIPVHRDGKVIVFGKSENKKTN